MPFPAKKLREAHRMLALRGAGELVTAFQPGDVRLRVEIADNQDAAQVIVRGEVDRSNLEQLQAALADVELDGQRAVGIDVSDLDFFDVAALRQLAAFVTRTRQSGREVTTRGARPMLQAAARALTVEGELGLT